MNLRMNLLENTYSVGNLGFPRVFPFFPLFLEGYEKFCFESLLLEDLFWCGFCLFVILSSGNMFLRVLVWVFFATNL